MRFFAIITLLATFTAASPLVEFVERADRPDPREVTVAKVVALGSGCPAGSFASSIGENGTAVSLLYSSFIAETGRNTKPSESRKNCNVQLTLNVPAGWSYTATNTILRGRAQMPKGCNAALGSRFFFTGRSEEARSSATFAGPFDADYVRETPVDALIWSTCAAKNREGPMFNVNSDARVTCDSRDKDAWLGVDTQESTFELKFLLQWRRC